MNVAREPSGIRMWSALRVSRIRRRARLRAVASGAVLAETTIRTAGPLAASSRRTLTGGRWGVFIRVRKRRPSGASGRQTERRALPLARRRARTFLPDFVRMRPRNPCFLLRFAFFGRYRVIFMSWLLVRAERTDAQRTLYYASMRESIFTRVFPLAIHTISTNRALQAA